MDVGGQGWRGEGDWKKKREEKVVLLEGVQVEDLEIWRAVATYGKL